MGVQLVGAVVAGAALVLGSNSQADKFQAVVEALCECEEAL